MNSVQILSGDVIEQLRTLPSESVHCVVTSPPYWGLRDYGYPSQIGLEATPEEYLDRMVEVFRHVRRVMHASGSLWLNMGDSYVSNPHGNSPTFDPKYPNGRDRSEGNGCNRAGQTGLKSKDLMMMPARDPLAMVVNPQPFSLEMCGSCQVVYAQRDYRKLPQDEKEQRICSCGKVEWVSHFATFPERMVTPCILAGTSEYGCCHHCGAPYERIVERAKVGDWHPNKTRGGDRTVPATCGMRADGKHARGAVNRIESKSSPNGDQFSSSRLALSREAARRGTGRHDGYFDAPETLGWRPTCAHPLFPSEITHCVVLDPFSGSGRTGLAAVKIGRSYIGIEGNPQYVTMSNWQFAQLAGAEVSA